MNYSPQLHHLLSVYSTADRFLMSICLYLHQVWKQ